MFVSKEEAEASVQMLMEMGFERPQVIRALRAGYFNPHRAVEYLTSVRSLVPAFLPLTLFS